MPNRLCRTVNTPTVAHLRRQTPICSPAGFWLAIEAPRDLSDSGPIGTTDILVPFSSHIAALWSKLTEMTRQILEIGLEVWRLVTGTQEYPVIPRRYMNFREQILRLIEFRKVPLRGDLAELGDSRQRLMTHRGQSIRGRELSVLYPQIEPAVDRMTLTSMIGQGRSEATQCSAVEAVQPVDQIS